MNGMRRALLATVVVSGVLVGACSVIPRVRIYNLTDATITLRIESEDPDRRNAFDELIAVAPGRHRTFHAGRVRSDRLPVKAGRCAYVYWLGDLPRELIDASGDTLAFDLKPDLSLHLSPFKGSGPSPTPEATKGFPRRAVSRSCA